MVKMRKVWRILGVAVTLSLVAAACGGGDDATDNGGDTQTGLTGSINVSGSSTVEPITSLVAEKFNASNPDVEISVSGPGTSDGFELFCNGETDLQDASRAIEEEEVAACEENGIGYVELEIAFDGLSVVGNPANPLECLAIGDLYSLFGPESEGFESWSDADALAKEVGGYGGFPDEPLTIVAPGTESGTFGSFIDLAVKSIAEERGQEETLRTDYQSSADDNVIIDNAVGNESGIGFVGLSYAEGAGDAIKEFQVDGGDGCVGPSPETVQDGSYPLSRSLYLYVSTDALGPNQALGPFIDSYLSDEGLASVEEVQYVALPLDRIEATRSTWESANT